MPKTVQSTLRKNPANKPKDTIAEIFNEGRKCIRKINEEIDRLIAIQYSLQKRCLKENPVQATIYDIASDRIKKLTEIRRGMAISLGEFVGDALKEDLF